MNSSKLTRSNSGLIATCARKTLGAAGVAVAVATTCTSAYAEYTLVDKGGFQATLGFKASAYAAYTGSANFGGGRIDLVTLQNTGTDVDSYEGYFEPVLNWLYDMGQEGTLYGAISGVAEGSAGDGDPIGYTAGDVRELDDEYLYVGWRGDTIDFSVGAQDFVVGDSFLIADGHIDAVDDLYWSAAHTAFRRTAIVRVNTDPVRADLFYLRSDETVVQDATGAVLEFSQGDTEVAGLNVEYLLGEEGANGTLGAMVLQVIDQNAPRTAAVVPTNRQGRTVIDVRANAVKFSQLPNFTFHGEYAHQGGEDDETGIEYDANAWYAEGEYSFANLPWTPVIGYRYGFWSGDESLTDNEDQSFDSLFYYAGKRGWGSWYQGEINGEYLLFNRNQKTHMIKAVAYPTDTISLWALWFDTRFDEPNYLQIQDTQSKDWGEELNLIVEWYPTENWYIVGVAAIAFPGDATAEVYGNDDYSLVQVQVLYTF